MYELLINYSHLLLLLIFLNFLENSIRSSQNETIPICVSQFQEEVIHIIFIFLISISLSDSYDNLISDKNVKIVYLLCGFEYSQQIIRIV